jgi:adenylate cyclase
MSASRSSDAGALALAKLVLLSVDLAGFARWAASREALDIAAMLDGWYAQTAAIVELHGGRIVKFMGDGAFAVFPEAACREAIAAGRALLDLSTAAPELRAGVSIHVAQVATGEMGPSSHRRFDVIGVGVNHLFRMGGGAGLRLSEPAYRQLPNAERSSWRKEEPPATYHLVAARAT